MELHVSLAGRRDLSGQIYRQIRAAIMDGRLLPGQAVPSTRELAGRLAVSRNTVGTAYDRLTETHRIVEGCKTAFVVYDARYEIPSLGFRQHQVVAVTWIPKETSGWRSRTPTRCCRSERAAAAGQHAARPGAILGGGRRLMITAGCGYHRGTRSPRHWFVPPWKRTSPKQSAEASGRETSAHQGNP